VRSCAFDVPLSGILSFEAFPILFLLRRLVTPLVFFLHTACLCGFFLLGSKEW